MKIFVERSFKVKSLILKASAGTGKTYRLSLEYIASLLSGESYKDIVVMTFTIKATTEIKERVVSFLEELNFNKNSTLYSSLRQLYPELDLSDARVKKIYDEVSENRERLRIYTIDSFINTIFKTTIAPYLKIFSYEIVDSNSEENTKILLKCFESILEKAEIFEKFRFFLENKTERRFDKYISTIKNLIENRWKIHLILRREDLKSRELFENNMDVENKVLYIIETFKEISKKKGKQEDIESFMIGFVKRMIQVKREKCREYLIENWKELLTLKKLYDGRRIKGKFQLEVSFEIEVLDRFLNDLKEWISKEIFNEKVYQIEKESLNFIENLYEMYDKIKVLTKKITHSDISNYVFENLENEELNLIKNGEITEYFKSIFDSKITNIFIDEFQDTSIVQWKILKNIMKASKRIICVGDEKQSIYGWREGEKALFENLSQILEIEEESLNVSYRSKKNLISLTNNIFSNISSQDGIDWQFTETECNSDEEGAYEIISMEDKKEEDSLSIMISHLKENFKENYSGICIIARTNRQLQEISSRLTEEKIPHILEKESPIIEYRAIKSIYLFMKFFATKEFFTLLEFLRSDLIYITNVDLKQLVKEKDKVLEYIFDEIENIELDKKLIDILNKIKFLLLKGTKNRDFILDFIEQFELCAYYHDEIDLKNIFKFYEISKNYDDILEFYDAISRDSTSGKYKQERLEKVNGITVMTIHKSKGLEFETVYFYCSPTGRRMDSKMKLYVDFDEEYEKIKNWVLIDEKFEKILEYLGKNFNFLEKMNKKQQEEEINNLYVALTRAKNNLILVTDKISSILGESLKGLKEAKNGEFKLKQYEEPIKIELREGREFNLREKELRNKDYEVKKIDIALEEKRVIGKAIHYYLEFIIFNRPDEHVIAREKTFSKYASLIGSEKLKNLLESEEFKTIFEKNRLIFSKEWDYIYPEYEIYYEGQLKRLDRLMIKKSKANKKGRVLIVDYKTGKIDQNQLNGYIHLIKEHIAEIDDINKYEIEGKFLEIKLLRGEE